MSSILILLFLFMGNISCDSVSGNKESNDRAVSEIDSLIGIKNYFEARYLFEKHQTNFPEMERLKIGIFLDYAFNKPGASVQKTNTLIKKYNAKLTDSLRYEISSLTHVNYSRLFEYKNAKISLKEMLADYPEYITEDERKNLENTLIVWKALENEPKQIIHKQSDLELKIIRDLAGLQNLEVTADTIKKLFVFDTGANFSTITASTADAFGITLLDGSFDVNAITGGKVVSRIGILPKFSIGSIEIDNAVFLVFPDDALAFPQIGYQIHGVLGFPVLEALGEIQITRDDFFLVPVESGISEERNMAIDFLTPLLWLQDSRGSGTYTFDTGASNTMLYDTYYQLHKDEFSGKEETFYSFGGAGGHVSKKGIYTTFNPEINGNKIAVDSVIVLKEPIKEENYFYGNIGQDFIGKFDKMILNFDQMFIKFTITANNNLLPGFD